MTTKTSADIHDQIDSAIKTDQEKQSHDKVEDVWNDITDEQALDKTHTHKIADHLIGADNFKNWGRRSTTLSEVLNHPKTDGKTVDSYFDKTDPSLSGSVELNEETLNKPGVSQDKLVNHIAKQIDAGNSESMSGLNSDILKQLNDRAKNLPEDQQSGYHGFIAQSYPHGRRTDKDYGDFKHILKQAMQFSDNSTIAGMFDDKHDVSHNTLLEMYHSIPEDRRKRVKQASHGSFLMEHPNIDKDYIAAAALDNNHDLHEDALQSKHLPSNVIDRLIADNNTSSIKHVMDSHNTAPENVEKIAEYGMSSTDPEIKDEYESFLHTNSDKLPTESLNKLYSMYRGADRGSCAHIIAESANSSDEIFMDSVNRGEKPSISNRTITPELAETLSGNTSYQKNLILNDDVPEHIKVKIAESSELSYKDVIGKYGNIKLPFSVQKIYMNKLSQQNKINGGLMGDIYHDNQSTMEDKATVLDLAVKGFKSKTKTKESNEFFKKGLIHNDDGINKAFDALKPENQASVINHIDKTSGYGSNVLSKLPFTQSSVKKILNNPALDSNARMSILRNPAVDVDTFMDSVSHAAEGSHKKAHYDNIAEKLKTMSSASISDLMNKKMNEDTFHSLPRSMQAALVANPDSDISTVNMTPEEMKEAGKIMGSDDEEKFVKKMSPEQADIYIANTDGDNLQKNWSALHDIHPEPVINKLAKLTSEHRIYNYIEHDDITKFGHHVIDKMIDEPTNNPNISVRNAAHLYRYEQDPDSTRLKNLFLRFGFDTDNVHTLLSEIHGVTGKHPFEDQSIVENLADFAPGGAHPNEQVWDRMVYKRKLPERLRYIAALTDSSMAMRHIASIHNDKGSDASQAEIDKMAQDSRTTPDSYGTLVEEKMNSHTHSNGTPESVKISGDTLNMVIDGFQNGKVNEGNIEKVMSGVQLALKDKVSDTQKHQFVSGFLNQLENSKSIDESTKDYQISKLLITNFPENTKQFLTNRVLESSIAKGDIARIERIGQNLENHPSLWSQSTLNTSPKNKTEDFLSLANSQLIDENGQIKSPQNWLNASKSIMNSIGNVDNDNFHVAFGDRIGKFIVAGLSNPITKDVSNLMVKAWVDKMSQQKTSSAGVEAFTSQLGDNEEALIGAFDAIKGPSEFADLTKEMVKTLSDRVTNTHQAAIIVDHLNQDKFAAQTMVKFSDMVSPGSELGRKLSLKMTDNHPLMSQVDVNHVINNMATKDPESYFDMLSAARNSTVSSAKMVSSAAMNLPHAIKTFLDGPKGSFEPHEAVSAILTFADHMNETVVHGLEPEDAFVARTHFNGQMIDGLTDIVKDLSVKELADEENDYGIGSVFDQIQRKFSYSLYGKKLNLANTEKVFGLATAIESYPKDPYHKKQAIDAVQFSGFSYGDINHQNLHVILANNPSAIFACAGNENFTVDHLQHYQPAKMFASLSEQSDFNVGHIQRLTDANSSFFDTISENKEKFNDEDRRAIAIKGFDFLTQHNKATSGTELHHDSFGKKFSRIGNFANAMVTASRSPTIQQQCLDYISNNSSNIESAALLLHAGLNPDQTAVALNNLENGFDFYNQFHHQPEAFLFAENLNYNQDSFRDIKTALGIEDGIYKVVLQNKNLSDNSIKLKMIDELNQKVAEADYPNQDLRQAQSAGLDVKGINQDQFNALTADMPQPQLFGKGAINGDETYRNTNFGGDRFRDLGITKDMKNIFQEMTGRTFDQNVAKYQHGKDLNAFNELLGMVPPAGLSWKDFKRANPKLAENQKIKNLFMGNKETVTPEIVTKSMSSLPGSYHITFGTWNGMQRHSANHNLVLQYNLDKSFENHLAQNPEMHKFFVDMQYESQTGHPVAPRSIMWTRIDATNPKGWVIEEIQSDFDSTLKSIERSMNKEGTVDIGGVPYTNEKIKAALKYFQKLLDDHVDVAHGYIEQLARQYKVPTLHMHGKNKRANMSGMDDDKDVPKWLEYKYETWPQQNGWSESTAANYPGKTKGSKKEKTWMKKLS